MPISAQTRRALLTTLGLLAAVALVAVASRGSTAVGSGDARRPAEALLDVLFTIYLLALVAGAALIVYMLLLRRHFEDPLGTGRRRPLITLLVMLGVVAGVALLIRRYYVYDPVVAEQIEDPLPAPLEGGPQTTGADPAPYVAEVAWLPVLGTLALVILAVGAWWLSGRARRRARGEEAASLLAHALVVAVDESLDDLRAEPDPRRAVIAAYARLEGVLAAHDLPRRPAEAPLEYLARILERLSVRPAAVERLTVLFERAKFSQHAVEPAMKDQAIAALEHVRDDLAAARALEEQERVNAQRTLLEQAAK